MPLNKKIIPPEKEIAKNGYTLLEAMVVILVAGIIASVFLPIYRDFMGRYRLYSAARVMAGEIRSLQQKSINLSLERYDSFSNTVQFGLGVSEYTISEVIPSNMAAPVLLKTKIQLPDRVKIRNTTFSNHRLVVNRGGGAASGGTVALRNDDTGKEIFIIVLTGSGRVRVDSIPPQ